MTKDEALRLAFEALEKISMGSDPRWADQAITAIEAVLEAKDEPDHSDELTIAYMSGLHRGKEVAQRTWVGLTDEEISASSKGHMTRNGFARAIEAKLKAKNS
jgi:hypothetical protein